jgi:recA bacterial DNA recombination protein
MATKRKVKVTSSRDKEVDEAIEQETGSSRKSKKAVGFDYLGMFNETLDEISKRQGVDTDLMEVVKPMSAGYLMLDLLIGGGIRPAFYGHAGFEQSCKTTGALEIMASAVKQSIPLISFWDFEGSTANSIPYLQSILKNMGITIPAKDIFGRRDKATGKWIIPPTVRYNAETRGEAFFDWFAAVLRELPDKKFVAGSWWLVFDENNKKHKAQVGDKGDANMKKRYGKGIWVPAPDGNLQGLVICDSWPAMNPESNDEEEANNALGVHARFFAKHLPRIKGRLARKMVALLGINQLREIPMAMYGPKEKEACGQALRFTSDVRTWWTSRSSGMPFNAKFDGEEKLEIERSVTTEGKDRYRYIQMSNKKNKLGQPGRKHWMRLWVQDAKGDAMGFDPFFDTMHYLKETGQLIAKNRKAMLLNLDELGKAKKTCDWLTFKTWVLGTTEEKKAICKQLGYDKAFDLRKFCFTQMAKGRGEDLYNMQKNKGKVSDDESAE